MLHELLKMCINILKEPKNMTRMIVINRDTVLMKLVTKVFPTSYDLLCRYHIIKNMTRRFKLVVETKKQG